MKLKDATKQKDFIIKITNFVKNAFEGETIQKSVSFIISYNLYNLYESFSQSCYL